MNDIIQSILTCIVVAVAVLWFIFRFRKPKSKCDTECKDCPIANKCNKTHKNGHTSCNC